MKPARQSGRNTNREQRSGDVAVDMYSGVHFSSYQYIIICSAGWIGTVVYVYSEHGRVTKCII